MKILSLTTFYPGSVLSFYKRFPEAKELAYKEIIELILSETTEFAASYTKNFKRSGLHAECIVANDSLLQAKWAVENSYKNLSAGDLLIKQITHFDPEILWIENLSIATPDFINTVKKESRNLKLIAGYHCAPAGRTIINNMRGVDIMFTCTPGLKDQYNAAGIRTFLVYHGFDEDFLQRLNRSGTIVSNRFIFSGSLTTGGQFHNERIRLINSVIESGIGIELYANIESTFRVKAKRYLHTVYSSLSKSGLKRLADNSVLSKFGEPVEKYSKHLIRSLKPPVYGIEMMELLSNSAVVLNFHIGAAGSYSGNMRMFEATGCGTCLLTDNKINIKDLFDPGNEVVTYDNARDCIEKARWLLNNPEARKSIAAAGQKRTLSAHMVRNRCETIREILQEELRDI